MMAKKENLHLEYLDFKLNTENPEECFLYDLIQIGLKSGKSIFFGLSYTVTPVHESDAGFIVKNHKRLQCLLRLLHMAFFFYLLVPFATEPISMSECCLVNFIRKGLIVVLICCLLASYRCMEISGRKKGDGLTAIFRQCVILQSKFNARGLHFPSQIKVQVFGWAMVFSTCLIAFTRQLAIASEKNPSYAPNARTFSRAISLSFWVPSNETTPENIQAAIGFIGILFDGLLANYWMSIQVFHLFLVVTMWLVFDKLNKAMKSGHFQVKHVPEVIDLHLQSTKLLKLICHLFSPLTFWFIVYDIACLCFWTNHISYELHNNFQIKSYFMVAVCVLIKTIIELALTADVNSQAHEITEWLEEACSEPENFPSMDLKKFTVFISQTYNKECAGFRGLRFFVVTPKLAITIVGIVITYTMAVNQLCRS